MAKNAWATPTPDLIQEPMQQNASFFKKACPECPEIPECTLDLAGWKAGMLDGPVQFMRNNFAWVEIWIIPAVCIGAIVILALIPGTRRGIRGGVLLLASLFNQRKK